MIKHRRWNICVSHLSTYCISREMGVHDYIISFVWYLTWSLRVMFICPFLCLKYIQWIFLTLALILVLNAYFIYIEKGIDSIQYCTYGPFSGLAYSRFHNQWLALPLQRLQSNPGSNHLWWHSPELWMRMGADSTGYWMKSWRKTPLVLILQYMATLEQDTLKETDWRGEHQ